MRDMGQGGWGPFKGLLGLPVSRWVVGRSLQGRYQQPVRTRERQRGVAGCMCVCLSWDCPSTRDEWRREAAVTWQARAIDPRLVAAIAQSHGTGWDEASWVDDDARKSSNKGFELRHQRLAGWTAVSRSDAPCTCTYGRLATRLLPDPSRAQRNMTRREQGQPAARGKTETRRVRPEAASERPEGGA
ncbi:hypothetical protein CCMA1212_000206 [Trichoderma ghanense]|uniref:Uncharacterized protein n=1 Tax=Trichoderma ghanense TaxID=65468 RepID=A0ABY2HHF4_9HYPO